MGYFEQSVLSQDPDFAARVTACAADEGYDEPDTWQWEHRFELAAAPGFADAYASALAGGVENPGRDPAVITDAQILGAVQAIGPDEPEPAAEAEPDEGGP